MFRTDIFWNVEWCFWEITALKEEILVFLNSVLLGKSISFGHHHYYILWDPTGSKGQRGLYAVTVLRIWIENKANHPYANLIPGIAAGWFQWAPVLTGSNLNNFGFILWYWIKIRLCLEIDLEGITEIVYFVVYAQLLPSFPTIILIHWNQKQGRVTNLLKAILIKSKVSPSPLSSRKMSCFGFSTMSSDSWGLADIVLGLGNEGCEDRFKLWGSQWISLLGNCLLGLFLLSFKQSSVTFLEFDPMGQANVNSFW